MSTGIWTCYTAKEFLHFLHMIWINCLELHACMRSNQWSYSRRHFTQSGLDNVYLGKVTFSDHTVVFGWPIKHERIVAGAKISPGWVAKRLLPLAAAGKWVCFQLEIADCHQVTRRKMKRRWKQEPSLWHCEKSLHSAMGLDLSEWEREKEN